MKLSEIKDVEDEFPTAKLTDLTVYPHCTQAIVKTLGDGGGGFDIPDDVLVWTDMDDGAHMTIDLSAKTKERSIGAMKDILKMLIDTNQISARNTTIRYQLSGKKFDRVYNAHVNLTAAGWADVT